MEDMSALDAINEPSMTVTFTSEERGEAAVYGLVPVVSNSSFVQTTGSGTIYPGVTYPGTTYPYPNIYTPEAQGDLEITHVVEEDDGLVGYTEDGTRVLLGDWVPTAVSLRVRSLLERIAGGDDLDESDLEKFCYLKRLLELQKEELENTSNRIEFIEKLISL
jgi:hypothetical protein